MGIETCKDFVVVAVVFGAVGVGVGVGGGGLGFVGALRPDSHIGLYQD